MATLRRRDFLTTAAAATILAVAPRWVSAQTRIKPADDDVLAVIDAQNCFLPGGTLPVPEGDKIIPIINRLAPAFRNVVITQDWHTKSHISFASSHSGKKPFETVALPYGTQVLWPDHCIQGTPDADLAKELRIAHAQIVIRKGYRQHVDSYSAFLEADRKTMTGLTGYLKERGLKNVYVVGLATDFCVAWSALDAKRAGFKASVIEDATRGIDAGGSLGKAWADMTGAGVGRIQSSAIAL
ncbi:MAG: nicotinamidase [Candidatus Rokubacteria bacterium]|nr:nicotinamidase [Candidatus Rokubacteria bacterium]